MRAPFSSCTIRMSLVLALSANFCHLLAALVKGNLTLMKEVFYCAFASLDTTKVVSTMKSDWLGPQNPHVGGATDKSRPSITICLYCIQGRVLDLREVTLYRAMHRATPCYGMHCPSGQIIPEMATDQGFVSI